MDRRGTGAEASSPELLRVGAPMREPGDGLDENASYRSVLRKSRTDIEAIRRVAILMLQECRASARSARISRQTVGMR
jgi:hypothetical protein